MKLFHTSAGEGPAILMIHGIISDHTFFDNILPFLADGHRVIRYDRRGYGLNWEGTDTEDWSVDAQIGDARELLSEEPEPVFVIAHSAGSLIALGLAERYPELVKGMILIEPALGCDEADAGVLTQFHRKMADLSERRKLLPALTVVSRAGGEAGLTRQAGGDTRDGLERMKANLTHFMYGELRSIHGYHADPERLKRIGVPIRVGISGSGEAMYASVSAHDVRLLGWPSFRLPEGHNCLRFSPEASARALLRELKAISES